MPAHAKRATNSRTTRSSSHKSDSTKSSRRSHTPPSRRWSAKVTTDSTHPEKGLFLKSASEIVRGLASKRVSPKGPASGMRMLTFYINRAGKNLSERRRHTLEHAKELLSERIAHDKEKSPNADHETSRKPRTRSAHRGGRRSSGSQKSHSH